MRGRSVALRGGGYLARILFQIIDELRDGVCLDLVRIDEHPARDLSHHGNRLELGSVITKLRIETLIHDERRRRRRHQRISVRSRAISDLGTDVTRSTSMIFDDDRLAPFARQPISDKARDDVGRSTGGKWNDDFDRVIRIVLGLCRTGEAMHRGKAKSQPDCKPAAKQMPRAEQTAHCNSSPYRRGFDPRLCYGDSATGTVRTQHCTHASSDGREI